MRNKLFGKLSLIFGIAFCSASMFNGQPFIIVSGEGKIEPPPLLLSLFIFDIHDKTYDNNG